MIISVDSHYSKGENNLGIPNNGLSSMVTFWE